MVMYTAPMYRKLVMLHMLYKLEMQKVMTKWISVDLMVSWPIRVSRYKTLN